MNATLVGGAEVEFPMRPVQRLLAEIVCTKECQEFSDVMHCRSVRASFYTSWDWSGNRRYIGESCSGCI